ncbi:cytochrome c biogenesis protein CcdA [uncultured Mailhella sp.]|uniref:cytochrome c biogenesis protein CcdA n=1 Tax=uncultured Mailhella sp. TaxID=1981031 RepID=UPI0026200A08|nr:cytochrome c biogenesis protein CcdA [uncultured Mailhella sp.]
MKKILARILAAGTLFAVLAALVFSSAVLRAADETPPYRFHTEWVKLSAVDGKQLAPPTDRNISMAVLWLIPSPGYHTYAHEPGDEGMPLSVSAQTEGSPISGDELQIRYVPGVRKALPDGGSSVVYKDATPVFLLFKEAKKSAVTLEVSLLACSNEHCQPVRTRILLPTAPPELKNAAQLPWFEALKKSRAADADTSSGEVLTETAPQTKEESAVSRSALLPQAHTSVLQHRSSGLDKPSVPVPTGTEAPAPKKEQKLLPQPLKDSFHIDSWLRAIGVGLLAGLLLNIMPCVLPVLTMKFSILLASSDSLEERRRSIREHTLYFAAGIVAWFTLLAVISGLTGMLWGQLFQSSEVIFFMLLIVFCMGLSMFDVFHLPVLDLQPDGRTPRMQAFTTGLFTTLLATPCSGPLLGGVLAWGMTKPLPVLMTIFASTGVGMALPYLLIACFPRLVHFLPRPGAWLSVLERILGLLLMATAIYLFSLLPPALHVKTLVTLLVAATASWIWGRWGSLRGSITRRMFLGTFAFLAIFLCGFWAFLPAQKETVPWVEYSEETFADYLGKKPMIVEFTADWCPTCKVLESTTLSAPTLLPIMEQYSVEAMKVDMTFKDKAKEDLLRALGSASIPLLAVFPAGEGAYSPVILRDIYTTTDLHLALRQAKIPHKRMVERLNPVKLLSQP